MPRTARRAVLRTAAAAVCLALVPALSGCAIGVDAFTTAQGPSGNGANANLGPMQLRAVTIVTGSDGSGAATILGTIVNSGATPDALVSVAITSPQGATVTLRGTALTGATLPLPAQSATRLGFTAEDHADITGLTIAPTAYATVELTFATAGRVTMPVMAVPPTGIYAGLGPLPAS